MAPPEVPMTKNNVQPKPVVDVLNRILEAELAGVVRYTHYSFLVFGHNRIPIVSWLREQATESLTHAQQAGEMITLLGEYPSPAIRLFSTRIAPISAQSCGNHSKPRRMRWGSTASC